MNVVCTSNHMRRVAALKESLRDTSTLPLGGQKRKMHRQTGTLSAHAFFHRERLHYAMDAEFVKGNGSVFARSVAFVPFFTTALLDSVDLRPAKSAPFGAVDSSSLLSCSSSSSSALSDGAQLLKYANTPMKGKGAAVQALLKAKLLKENKTNGGSASDGKSKFISSHRATPPEEFARQEGPCVVPSSTNLPVVVKIPPSVYTPKTIVVALRHGSVLDCSDVLPCGHTLDSLMMQQMPRSFYTGVVPYATWSGRPRGFDRAGWKGMGSNTIERGPLAQSSSVVGSDAKRKSLSSAVPTSGERVLKNNAAGASDLTSNRWDEGNKYARLAARLNPFTIPCVTTVGPLLLELYRAAMREDAAEKTTNPLEEKGLSDPSAEQEGLLVSFTASNRVETRALLESARVGEDDEDDDEILTISKEGGGQVDKTARVMAVFKARMTSATQDTPPSFDELLEMAEKILGPVSRSGAVGTLMRSSRLGSKLRGRSFLRDLKTYRASFLRNYFPHGEEQFMAFLEECEGLVRFSLASSEPRYTDALAVRVPWSLLTGAAEVASGTNPRSTALAGTGLRPEERVAAATELSRSLEGSTEQKTFAEDGKIEKDAWSVFGNDERICKWTSTNRVCPHGSAYVPPSASAPAHHYVLCDTLEEFAVATSAIWSRLMAVDDDVMEAMQTEQEAIVTKTLQSGASVGEDAAEDEGDDTSRRELASFGSQTKKMRPILSTTLAATETRHSLSSLFGSTFAPSAAVVRATAESALFYSYGSGDAPVVRATVSLVREMRAEKIEEIVRKLRLESLLDEIHPLSPVRASSVSKLEEAQNARYSDAAIGNRAAQPQQTHPLMLRSPFLVSIRDITMHSLFAASGIPHTGNKVPKLVDTLQLIAPQCPEARLLLRSSATDNHNPLWDAAALGAICSFVLRMKR